MCSPAGTDVIIVNWRSEEDTLGAVADLRHWPGRLWVVHNSPETGSDSWRARLRAQANVQLLEPGENLGFGRGCNLAWAAGTADAALLLNPDARLDVSGLTKLVDALAGDARLGGLAPACYWDRDRRFWLPTLLPETAAVWLKRSLAARWPTGWGRWLGGRWIEAQRRQHRRRGVQPVAALAGGVLLLRRSAVEVAGGLFDPRFFMFYEDADLCLRLRRAGFALGLLPEVAAVHAFRHTAEKVELMLRYAPEYVAVHYPRLQRWSRHWGAGPAHPFAPLAEAARARWQLAHPPHELDSPAALDAWLDGRRLLAISPEPTGMPAILRADGGPASGLDGALWARLPAIPYMLVAEGPGGVRDWLWVRKTEGRQP